MPTNCIVCMKTVSTCTRIYVSSQLLHHACFNCVVCRQQLSIFNYHETEPGVYRCDLCFQPTGEPDDLNNTLVTSNCDNASVASKTKPQKRGHGETSTDRVKEHRRWEKEAKEFKCPHCGKTTTTRAQLVIFFKA